MRQNDDVGHREMRSHVSLFHWHSIALACQKASVPYVPNLHHRFYIYQTLHPLPFPTTFLFPLTLLCFCILLRFTSNVTHILLTEPGREHVQQVCFFTFLQPLLFHLNVYHACWSNVPQTHHSHDL